MLSHMCWTFDKYALLLSTSLPLSLLLIQTSASSSHRAVLAGAEAAGRDTAPDRDLRPRKLHQWWRGAGGPEGACAV